MKHEDSQRQEDTPWEADTGRTVQPRLPWQPFLKVVPWKKAWLTLLGYYKIVLIWGIENTSRDLSFMSPPVTRTWVTSPKSLRQSCLNWDTEIFPSATGRCFAGWETAPSRDSHSVCPGRYRMPDRGTSPACRLLAFLESTDCSRSKRGGCCRRPPTSQPPQPVGHTSSSGPGRALPPARLLLTWFPRSRLRLLQSLWNWRNSSVSLFGHLRVNFYLLPEPSGSLGAWDRSVFQCPAGRSRPGRAARPGDSHTSDFCLKTAAVSFRPRRGSWWSPLTGLSG